MIGEHSPNPYPNPALALALALTAFLFLFLFSPRWPRISTRRQLRRRHWWGLGPGRGAGAAISSWQRDFSWQVRLYKPTPWLRFFFFFFSGPYNLALCALGSGRLDPNAPGEGDVGKASIHRKPQAQLLLPVRVAFPRR
jgi:hypothetical protein